MLIHGTTEYWVEKVIYALGMIINPKTIKKDLENAIARVQVPADKVKEVLKRIKKQMRS